MPVVELDGKPFAHQINLNLIPPYGLEMERTLHLARLEMARRYAWENRLNRITVPTPGAWLGILTSGKTYYDVRQALARAGPRRRRAPPLRDPPPQDGHAVPDGAADRARVRARACEEILVIEEKRAFLEMFAKDILYGMRRSGRGSSASRTRRSACSCPRSASWTPTWPRAPSPGGSPARSAIESAEARIQHLDELKRRPRTLQLWRAPRTSARAARTTARPSMPDGAVAAAGIGCHGMAMGMNRGIIGVTHMGGEGAQWVGVVAVHRDAAPLPEHRRRHALPLRQARGELRDRLGREHHVQDPLQRRRGHDGRPGRRRGHPHPRPHALAGGRGRQADHHHHRPSREVQGRRCGPDHRGVAPRPAPRGAVGARGHDRASPCSSTTSSARRRSGGSASAAGWSTRPCACSSTSACARAAATAARSPTACPCSRWRRSSAERRRSTSRRATRTTRACSATARPS